MVGKHYCELLELKMEICKKQLFYAQSIDQIIFPLVQKTGQRFLLSH